LAIIGPRPVELFIKYGSLNFQVPFDLRTIVFDYLDYCRHCVFVYDCTCLHSLTKYRE
jgi:hypothetical protein